MSEKSMQQTTTDENGLFSIELAYDHFEVEELSVGGSVIPDFTAVFHRPDGNRFATEGYMTAQIGYYTYADDPYQNYYTITAYESKRDPFPSTKTYWIQE